MVDQLSNDPKVLVEFSPEEISWMADRWHEMRAQWTSAEMMGARLLNEEDSPMSDDTREKIEKAKKEIEEHKLMEARLRNRVLDKAADQGFGDL